MIDYTIIVKIIWIQQTCGCFRFPIDRRRELQLRPAEVMDPVRRSVVDCDEDTEIPVSTDRECDHGVPIKVLVVDGRSYR